MENGLEIPERGSIATVVGCSMSGCRSCNEWRPAMVFIGLLHCVWSARRSGYVDGPDVDEEEFDFCTIKLAAIWIIDALAYLLLCMLKSFDGAQIRYERSGEVRLEDRSRCFGYVVSTS